MAIKITKSELQNLIKEEALKFKKALALKKELAKIEKELNECGGVTAEVTAGGAMSPGDNGVHAGQRKPVFATKGNPNLKMEDGIEGEENSVDVEGDTIDKAAILDAIENLKIALGLVPAEEKEGGADEELEFNAEDLKDEEPAAEEGDSEEKEGRADEEEADVVPEAKKPEEEGKVAEVKMESKKKEEEEGKLMGETKEEEEEEGKTMEENLDEPIEGKSVAQEADADKVNDNMEKSKHVKEGVENTNSTLLEDEKKRMAHLAGIIRG